MADTAFQRTSASGEKRPLRCTGHSIFRDRPKLIGVPNDPENRYYPPQVRVHPRYPFKQEEAARENKLQIVCRSCGAWRCRPDRGFRSRSRHSRGPGQGNRSAYGRRQSAGPGPHRSTASTVLERSSQGRRRVEGADPDARRPDHQDAARSAREIRREVRADDDRGRELLHAHSRQHSRTESRSPAGSRARRRLCLRSGRGRNARSNPDGRFRQVQGDLDRLPNAAGFSISGCDGRRDGGVEGGRKDERPEKDGDIRNVHRRRDDARDGAARQDGRSAAPRRHGARHPMVGHDKTGDTFFTNEKVDNILVSNDGWLGDAAKLYANGHDLRDPQLSPVYGDFSGFPPTILTSGTRDLFLSNTVRVHRKLRQAGVVADLHVFEGQSHAQYAGDPDAPETKEHFGELTAFFDKYLAK